MNIAQIEVGYQAEGNSQVSCFFIYILFTVTNIVFLYK